VYGYMCMYITSASSLNHALVFNHRSLTSLRLEEIDLHHIHHTDYIYVYVYIFVYM